MAKRHKVGSKIWVEAMIRDREVVQARIRQVYGEKAIKEARKRLCDTCVVLNCLLLPICLDGTDCPYYKRRKDAKHDTDTGRENDDS